MRATLFPHRNVVVARAIAAASLALVGCQSERAVTSSPNDEATTASVGASSVVVAAPPSGSTVSAGISDSVRLEAPQSVRRGRVVRWSSSNTSVVWVTQQGLAVATAVGTATVSATGIAGVDNWTFEVTKPVVSLAVARDSVNIALAATSQLTVVLRASDSSVVAGRHIAYATANALIATVSTTGLISARAVGTTTVSASVGSVSRTVRVVVSTVPVTPTTPTTPTTGELGLNAALNTRLLFPADNAWNQPVDTAAVDANSAAIIANIGATKSFHPDFGANYDGGPFGIPYYVVSNAEAGVNVTFDYDDESDHGLYPIPSNAPIEGGASSDGDRHVLIVNRDTWKLYELYYAFPNTDGSWRAGSGAIFDLASNVLRPAGWTSADAAGLPILPGLVRYDEVSAGLIAHAIRFTVSRSRKAYVAPARHSASSDTSSLRPPMGMRVRLKSTVNISSYPASAQVILRALRKYGMIVADNGSDWYASGTADARWNDNEINALKALKGSDFEVVRMTGVIRQ